LGLGLGLGLGGLLCASASASSSSSRVDRKGESGEAEGEDQDVERERGVDVWVPPDKDSFERYTNGGHVDTCVCPGYWSGVERFINNCLSLRT